MSRKKIKINFLVFFLILAINLTQVHRIRGIEYLNSSQNKHFEKILDKNAGFILEENAIKVIKPLTTTKERPKKDNYQSEKNIHKKELYIEATAYSSSVLQCDASPFITASGTKVHFGTVAANFLPFGTKIKIPEYFGEKIFIVEDRMASRYQYRIDIWMPSYKEAINFGKRNLKIVIIN